MARKKAPVWYEIEIEDDGKVHKGSYSVDGRRITVTGLGGRKVTLLSGSDPVSLARRLLLEIVFDRRRGRG